MLETERLLMRELRQEDFDELRKILQDPEVMVAYEGAFTDQEVQDWLDRQLSRYREDGFGLYAVLLKETGALIGQCGLTLQNWKDQKLLEIGYLLQKAYWHKGYATEAAKAWKEYAFTVLGAEKVCSIIRETNTASRSVAVRNGMQPIDHWIKRYRNVDMPHLLYSVSLQNGTRFGGEEA